MLNLFNSSFAAIAFWVLAPLSLIGSLYAIVSAIRGWHKYAYVSIERYTTLKQHAQESSNESCYFAEMLEEVSKALSVEKRLLLSRTEERNELQAELAQACAELAEARA
tara:strand:+ start:74 stop:400 length:327 start_codon:yes stop_codon:yes gene_type:complete